MIKVPLNVIYTVDAKETRILFKDAEEGSMEIFALKEERGGSEEIEGDGEGGEKPAGGEDADGVESNEALESGDKGITLSTFGHANGEKESGDDKKENETKIGEPTSKVGLNFADECTHKVPVTVCVG